MGDRGNVLVLQGGGEAVYLYTHWAGPELPGTVQAALKRAPDRWTDTAYLARIVFSEMTRGESPDKTTGYGISTRLCDNEHPLVVIDCEAERIAFRPEEPATERAQPIKALEGWSFKDFCALTDPDRTFHGR